MKKVLCNVLYDATLDIAHRELGGCVLKVGLFDDWTNAKSCAKILSSILILDKTYDIRRINYYKIDEKYVPDNKLESLQVIKSVDEFLDTNGRVKLYAHKHGQKALMEIVDPIIIDANKTWVLDAIK